ncbi:hypothetical protein AB6A40_008674 [Gnathostoma spinigerum]|uniref:RING finger protein 207 n=1 Tax=Gnathostoma spinigerum TaxID=75299 RepID=A0ABD6EPS1_9BILA
MACPTSLLMFKLENAETRNPLECLICDKEFENPVRLPCHHSYCLDCIRNKNECPVCGCLVDDELTPDRLLTFLIDTSHETADVCANCDKISMPMHFCETCQQPLCNQCRLNTHQAKMFAAHRIALLEERGKVKGRILCPLHGEPYILYSIDTRSLACIVCFNNAALDSRHHLIHIDTAHKMGCEKLEKAVAKLRTFQDDIREQLQLRKRLAIELCESHRASCESIRQTYQEMFDAMLFVRDRLLKKLDEEKEKRERHFHEQMRYLIALQPSIRLYLLSSSIFCSSASKLDFLQSSNDLLKRIQGLLSMECEKPQFTGEIEMNFREEFSHALEPYLGLSSVLMNLPHRCISESSSENTDKSVGQHRRSSYVRRSGSVYTNGSSLPTKYHLLIDLAGAFGEHFSKVEAPLRQYDHEMTNLGRRVQEVQRDLTLRKCMVRKEELDALVKK